LTRVWQILYSISDIAPRGGDRDRGFLYLAGA
jgi:hypothetical protein